MVTLVIEFFYALVFLQSLLTYLRGRDPVQRDLTLVFAPFTSLLVLEVIRRSPGIGELPIAIRYVAVTLLLAQPLLTMWLVRTLRPVPPWAMSVAAGIFLVTTTPFLLLGGRVPLVTLAVVVGFFGVQGAAATLLVREGLRRAGAPRVRLMLAATATAVLGLCLLIAGAGEAAGRAEMPFRIASQGLALLSGLGYVVAFMPPRWLRRVWAGDAAFRIHHQMATAPVDESPDQTWRRYVTTVRQVSGADAAAVLLPADAVMVCAAISGDADSDVPAITAAGLQELLERSQPITVSDRPGSDDAGSLLLAFARHSGARALIVVPLQLPMSGRGALALLSRRHPLFVEDDARLLGELGTQAAILAQRGAAAEAIRTVNAQLERRVQERTAELRVAQAALEDVNYQLEAQNAMLERSNEELQRFAYVASHDLQEPLRKIISFSGLLVERMPGNLDADTAMYVDRIVGSAARMKRLIEDLLMFSRVGGSVELRPVDCGLALRSVLDSLAIALGESRAAVTHDPLPVILTNRTWIEQVLQNLIGNALKYRSDAAPRIHVSAERVDEGWRIAVADNGIGLEMRYAERIFQVFQRLHPRGQFDGTGIGLAVCKRIVEACGGSIGVDSTAGAGSTFWFILPSAQPSTAQPSTADPSQEKPDAAVAHAVG